MVEDLQPPLLSNKTRRLMTHRDDESGGSTSSRTLSPFFMGAKSENGRDDKAGRSLGAFRGLELNGLKKKEGGSLPGELGRNDRRKHINTQRND